MQKDPVCGMQVDPHKAAGKVSMKERHITFAQPAARGSLMRIPAQYAGK